MTFTVISWPGLFFSYYGTEKARVRLAEVKASPSLGWSSMKWLHYVDILLLILLICVIQWNKVHQQITKLTAFEPFHEISINVVCVTSKGSDQPAHMQSLIKAFSSCLNILRLWLLTKHHLEFLSLRGGCTGSPESTLVKCHLVEITSYNVFVMNVRKVLRQIQQ